MDTRDSKIRDEYIELLESTLRPFAELDIDHMKGTRDDIPVWGINGKMVTVGEVRKAKRALGMEVPEYDPKQRHVVRAEDFGKLGDFAKKSGKI